MNSRSEERPWIPRALRDILHRSSCKVRCAPNRKNGEMINVSICQEMTSSPWSALPGRANIATGLFPPSRPAAPNKTRAEPLYPGYQMPRTPALLRSTNLHDFTALDSSFKRQHDHGNCRTVYT